MRKEKDSIGELSIPDNALYGIHSVRAKENFPSTGRFHYDWYRATGKVKLACYVTYRMFRDAIISEHPDLESHLRLLKPEVIGYLEEAAREVSDGMHYDQFIVPAIQGGAGTSINLNINEIICNRSLVLAGKKPGTYDYIDPIESANIYQSTNDVIPTSLVVAAMEKLNILEKQINLTRAETEKLETKYRRSLRLAYTQLQAAVPSTWGILFSTFSDALSRDWWRVSKASERIKEVNLGGGAIGTSLSIPRYFLTQVVPELRKLTALPVYQAENLADSTSNLDSFVEVHAILKAHAVNLEKMVSDLRLLASSVNQPPELFIPARQTGSSIMPGKINPVIPEFVISGAHEIYANDTIITGLAGMGNLELNAYLPSIGNALLKSLDLLISMNASIANNLLTGISIDEETSRMKLLTSPAVTTALSHLIGYNNAAIIAAKMKELNCDIFLACRELNIIDIKTLEELLSPDKLLKKGFTMRDIRDIEGK